jgi:arginyl-tRNA synthetase
MNIYQDFTDKIINILKDIEKIGKNADFSRLSVEPPRDSAHGHLASNAAMVLAKPVGMNPRELAGMIAAGLENDADVASVEIAGPGFINLRPRQNSGQITSARSCVTGLITAQGSSVGICP